MKNSSSGHSENRRDKWKVGIKKHFAVWSGHGPNVTEKHKKISFA